MKTTVKRTTVFICAVYFLFLCHCIVGTLTSAEIPQSNIDFDQLEYCDKLDFMKYEVFYPDNGLPPVYPKLVPNVVKGLPVCASGKLHIDQYGQEKFYSKCNAISQYNWGEYPPLYEGDIFPVFGQLYYFEKPYIATKIKDSELLTKQRIIIPLTPSDVLPKSNWRLFCRESGVVKFDFHLSLVNVAYDIDKKTLIATILSHDKRFGSFRERERRGITQDSFQTRKQYKIGDIIVVDYRNDERKVHMENGPLVFGYRVTKIVPPDEKKDRLVETSEGAKKGRLIGWVEIDPTPIPLDEKGNPIEKE